MCEQGSEELSLRKFEKIFFESFQEVETDVGVKSGILNEQFSCLAGSEPCDNPQII